MKEARTWKKNGISVQLAEKLSSGYVGSVPGNVTTVSDVK